MAGPKYDALLVHHLARELRDRLLRATVLRLRLGRDERRATLELDRGALIWGLHPLDGRVRFDAPPADEVALEWRSRSTVADVRALPDERILEIEIATRGGADAPTALVVELMTNQWNLLVLDRERRIRIALRQREAGRRSLRAGQPYLTPRPLDRAGVDAPLTEPDFRVRIEGTSADERARALVRDVAWTSPLNAPFILGSGDDPAAAHARYAELVPPAAARPALLADGQPYPHPLGDPAAQPYPSLLDAFAALGAGEAEPSATPAVAPELLARLRRRVERITRREERLGAELAGAQPEADALRRRADLLLAQPQAAPKGADAANLDDFEGGTLAVALDPALDAFANARAWYDSARRRERAGERIPPMLETLAREREALERLRERAEAGDAPESEILAALPARATGSTGADEGPALPYRSYTTSGGLEVRVGRGSRTNDALTFHHSSPNDIWLHARDVAGAHVILRWGHADANPPQRDLIEAAILAALGSKARTSGTVAVDWTLRKYVRKPRKAAPGLVIPERVKTVFVEPDPEVEKRLRR